MPATISKSKYIAGLQCPRLLWHHYNQPDAFPPTDAGTEALFDTAHRIGDLAKRLYPDGVEVPWNRDLAETTASTQKLLRDRKPIFEASFEVDGCYCRADIMVPTGNDAWDLYEVKSATKVKDASLQDISFQTHAIERSGVRLGRLFLMHIDRSYVRQGAVDPRKLFHAVDVTVRARALQPNVAANVAEMHTAIGGDRPNTPIGQHCFAPYDCNLWDQCSSFLPEHSVLDLYRTRKKKIFDLIASGITALTAIPNDDLSPRHLIQQHAIASGQPLVQPDELRAWLSGLQYPLHCFDFETMNATVPLFDGTRPYHQVPFQFSLHIVDSEGAAPRHVEFLAESPEDPRPALLDALRSIGPTGTILAYNMNFERRVLQDLANEFPAHAAFLSDLDGRFMDLITPFTKFWYHSAEQRGSCSLKHVLPALTGTTYDDLEISDGGQAAREYQRVVHGEANSVEPEEATRVLSGLRAYCEQDTQALVDVLEALRKLAGT